MRKALSTALIISVCAMQQIDAAPHAIHDLRTSPTTSQLLATRTFNAAGQVINQGDSNNQFDSLTYNTKGQIIQSTDRDHHVVTEQYNAHGLPTQQAASGNNASNVTTTISYDPVTDQPLTKTIQSGSAAKQTMTFNYNLAGEMATKTYPNKKGQHYTYTREGRVHTFTNIAGQMTTYTYSPMHQLQSVAINGDTAQYTYTPFGQPQQSQRTDGITTTWTYDDYNGIANVTSKNGSNTLQNITYTYDTDGNIADKQLTDGTQYQYAYNHLNELTDFNCKGTSCPKDQQGQVITARNYTYTLNRGIQSIGTNGATPVNYTYYPNYPDRLEKIGNGGTYQYDANGNMTTNANGNTMTYNALNQMTQVTPPAKSNTPAETFAYNADGKLDQEGTDPSNLTTLYYSIGKTPTITAKTQGTAVDTYALGTSRLTQYYLANPTENTTPVKQDYLSDQHGDVTDVISSGSNGNNDTHYLYTPFGKLTQVAPAGEKTAPPNLGDNTFGYTGQSLNSATGLMVMGGYRAYDPNIGLFLKQDSYSAFQGEGTFNGFDYAAGNPVIWIDPTGHMPWWGWLVDSVIAVGGLAAICLSGGAAIPAVGEAEGAVAATESSATTAEGAVAATESSAATAEGSVATTEGSVATNSTISSALWAGAKFGMVNLGISAAMDTLTGQFNHPTTSTWLSLGTSFLGGFAFGAAGNALTSPARIAGFLGGLSLLGSIPQVMSGFQQGHGAQALWSAGLNATINVMLGGIVGRFKPTLINPHEWSGMLGMVGIGMAGSFVSSQSELNPFAPPPPPPSRYPQPNGPGPNAPSGGLG